MRQGLVRVPTMVALVGAAGLAMLIPAAKAFSDGQAPVGRAFLYWALLCLLAAVLVAIAGASSTRRPGAQGDRKSVV